MPDFPHLRCIRANRTSRKDYEPRTLMDMVLDGDDHRPVQVSVVTIGIFGSRARSQGSTGFAALRNLYREHPVLVRCLCTWVSVMWLMAAVAVANSI
ncbi:hypothetical protein [Streptomyces sp. bgisy154]|uniref:hypothetical protein n=1 Tax=Streptomyces sp. bgisy154 TaxID=3413794 RepID=UPI003D70450C